MCDASLFYERIGENNISIAVGMLDSNAGLKTLSHIFMYDNPDYYLIETSYLSIKNTITMDSKVIALIEIGLLF